MAEKIIERSALNFTDLTGAKTGCTTLGSNKFWTGEVVQRADGLFDFRCRWGSTGTPGSDKGSKYGISEAAALSTLRSKVASKKKKGYTELDTRSQADEVAKAAAKGVDLTNGGAKIAPQPQKVAKTGPALHPEVERLLGVIYGSTSNVVRSGLSAQAGATEDNPIGNLSDAQLDLGGGILDDIGDILKQHFGRESSGNRSQEFPLRSDGTPEARIIDLTNRYMSNVPREIPRDMRGKRNLHRIVISSYERLQEQRDFLQLLRDAHIAQATFQAAAQATAPSSKAHVWYDGLSCDIDTVPVGSAEFRRVSDIFGTGLSRKNSNWWNGNQPAAKIVRVFKFTRKGSGARFDAYADRVCSKPGATGKIMAWHGTKVANLLGIGKSGLLMPDQLPRGISRAGAAFGRGVYHAPCWPATGHKMINGMPTDGTNGAFKSLNYTGASRSYYGAGSSRNVFMFLQEVALGLADVHTVACWDKHRPNGWPKNDFIFACGSRNRGGFVHDELVTFDSDAQVFRYLIEFSVS